MGEVAIWQQIFWEKPDFSQKNQWDPYLACKDFVYLSRKFFFLHEIHDVILEG